MKMKKKNLPENPEMNEEKDEVVVEETAAAESAEVTSVAETEEPADKEDLVAEAEGEETEESADKEDLAEEDEEEIEAIFDQPKKKKRSRANTRKLRFGAMATGLTAVVVVAVVLLNVVVGILADRFPLNIDLTKDKTYSLQKNSEELIRSVDKEVEVLVFAEEALFRDGLGSQVDEEINVILRQYYEALNSCVSMSSGKIKVTYLDTTDPTLATKYSKYEPNTGDTLLLCGDRYQKVGLSDLYEYTESDDYYSYYGSYGTYTSRCEQALMSKLSAVSSDIDLVMTIFTGHQENSETVSGLTTLFTDNGYTVEQMNLATEAEINEKCTLGIIAAPSNDYTEAEIKRLRDWMNNGSKLGRNLMVVVNYAAECPNLYAFLKDNYQIEVTNNLIQETDMNRIVYMSYYQSLVDVQETDVTTELGGKTVIMGPTRQLLALGNSTTEGGSGTIPLVTYGDSARLVPMKDVLDEDAPAEDTSFRADSYPINGAVWYNHWDYDRDNNSAVIRSNVLVFGGMQMMESSMLQMASIYNEDVVLSSVNTVVGNEAAVSVSSKAVSTTTITYTETAIYAIGIIFVLVIPLITLVICLVVFLRRRHL